MDMGSAATISGDSAVFFVPQILAGSSYKRAVSTAVTYLTFASYAL